MAESVRADGLYITQGKLTIMQQWPERPPPPPGLGEVCGPGTPQTSRVTHSKLLLIYIGNWWSLAVYCGVARCSVACVLWWCAVVYAYCDVCVEVVWYVCVSVGVCLFLCECVFSPVYA